MSWLAKAQSRRERQLCAFLIFAYLTVLQTGCSSTSTAIADDATAQLPPSQRIELPVFYPQIEDQCGPASLATMLAYRGLSVTAQSLRGKIYIPGKEGSLTTEIVARTRQYKLLPYVLSPSLADILIEVSAGNPVLVMQNLGFDWLPRWHFSIVTGFDLEEEIVIQRSGNEKALETPFDLFEKTWQRADRWALVITPPDKLPETAQQSAFIQAALELELVGETEAAKRAYLAARERWPNANMALFGAGNTSYKLKEFAQATSLYREYVALTPDSASGWNNLAHSLMQLECADESIKAICCALSIDPTNPEYQDSQRELLERRATTSGHGSKSSCAIPRCPMIPSG